MRSKVLKWKFVLNNRSADLRNAKLFDAIQTRDAYTR